ncbi:hypothetical protein pEaSNUABM11_00031 [Erwinia phage pEa_SNUABM_11]|nr:hypothetical protein pEaSNUABM11_00031 [Erwinia phage pEa_SNUABM_11]
MAAAAAKASEIRRELEERGMEQIVCHRIHHRHIRFTAYDPKKKRAIESNGIVTEEML